jgi:putative flippase GtrA
MSLVLRKVARALYAYRVVRAVYGYCVRTVGRRFTRFAVGSAIALAVSEVTLLTCLGLVRLWPTVSAVIAWFAGAAASYVMSRWAWERRGRPHLLKETVPFWLIAVGTIVVLSAATSLAHHLAVAMGLRPLQRLAFVGAAYLVANTVTFLTRFVIFHYVLFADRGSMDSARVSDDVPAAAATSSATILPPEAAALAAAPRPRMAGERFGDDAFDGETAVAPVLR